GSAIVLHNNQILLFGGVNEQGSQNDTWVWDGSNWFQLTPSSPPPKRYAAGFAYIMSQGKSLLFAGTNEFTGNYSDTWSFDGTNWQQEFPGEIPAKRFFPMMAFNRNFEKVVLFGGGQ